MPVKKIYNKSVQKVEKSKLVKTRQKASSPTASRDTKSPFAGYLGTEEAYWTRHHRRYAGNILAVGRGNTTIEENRREYATASEQFKQLVSQDFPDNRSSISVLDCGYGHGHYARACHALGVGKYVGVDFASETKPDLGPSFTFAKQDLSVPFDLGQKFDLVICIDVIFHVVDDAKFQIVLQNIRRHAGNKIYITSLFRTYVAKPYVKHRPLEAFAPLGAKHLSTQPWRDNSLARFEVNP